MWLQVSAVKINRRKTPLEHLSQWFISVESSWRDGVRGDGKYLQVGRLLLSLAWRLYESGLSFCVNAFILVGRERAFMA
jgi:hypothetical protein